MNYGNWWRRNSSEKSRTGKQINNRGEVQYGEQTPILAGGSESGIQHSGNRAFYLSRDQRDILLDAVCDRLGNCGDRGAPCQLAGKEI